MPTLKKGRWYRHRKSSPKQKNGNITVDVSPIGDSEEPEHIYCQYEDVGPATTGKKADG
jgi:hypothetical protein